MSLPQFFPNAHRNNRAERKDKSSRRKDRDRRRAVLQAKIDLRETHKLSLLQAYGSAYVRGLHIT